VSRPYKERHPVSSRVSQGEVFKWVTISRAVAEADCAPLFVDPRAHGVVQRYA
jgi:hypothetical protein